MLEKDHSDANKKATAVANSVSMTAPTQQKAESRLRQDVEVIRREIRLVLAEFKFNGALWGRTLGECLYARYVEAQERSGCLRRERLA